MEPQMMNPKSEFRNSKQIRPARHETNEFSRVFSLSSSGGEGQGEEVVSLSSSGGEGRGEEVVHCQAHNMLFRRTNFRLLTSAATILKFPIRICFGFRYWDFGFPTSTITDL